MRRLAGLVVLFSARVAAADSQCRSVDVELVPSDQLQIAAWIEDAQGHYVDTAFITQSTGLRGLGNRPGIMDVHSGPKWPYGSRLDVLPIWAHRHGLLFPQLIWQGASDTPPQSCDIDTTFANSSRETFYCRPMQPVEPMWDAGTCATTVFTDKGKFSTTVVTPYPPRGDIVRSPTDSSDASMFAELDPFDTVSRATPPADVPYRVSWSIPATLADGDYVLRVEVSKEFDFNDSYTQSTYPTTQCLWLEYGMPYRGQPSVLYEVPFTIGAVDTTATTATYAGYSDLDGNVHVPDATISTDTPGSGSSRLRIAIDSAGAPYRVRVTSHPEGDAVAPDAPSDPRVTHLEPTRASLTFIAPGDDGNVGTVSGYDVRYRIGNTLDDSSFESATPGPAVTPVAAGELQTIAITDLAPQTPYVVAVRAYDNCNHQSPLVVARFETFSVEVSGCGCTSSDPTGLALGLLGLRLRRRRRRPKKDRSTSTPSHRGSRSRQEPRASATRR